MNPASSPSRTASRFSFKRLLVILLSAAVLLYVLGVAGGYCWLRYGRDIEEVRVLDVAFARFDAIRRTMAKQHFALGQKAWDAKEYQQAFVYYSSAVVRDPDNIDGRLKAAELLGSLGSTGLQINMLQDGLVRAPEDRRLNETLFTLLLATGRTQKALELLHGSHQAALAGANRLFLLTVELQATLQTGGAAAAKGLLGRNPELRRHPLAQPVVARVLWETSEKDAAIELMRAELAAKPDNFSIYPLLTDWLRENGQGAAAIELVFQACERFPGKPAPRVLLLHVGTGEKSGTPEWWKEIVRYLHDFEHSREAVLMLAELAGRRGWLDLTGTLYELSARRGQDLGLLALFHSDALARNGRIADVRQVLEEIEAQSAAMSPPFLLLLRQREIAAAAATGDRDAVREYSRRLAGMVRQDPDRLEQLRRFYQQVGIAEAVAELSERKSRPASSTPKKEI